jgi:hypothetical protein
MPITCNIGVRVLNVLQHTADRPNVGTFEFIMPNCIYSENGNYEYKGPQNLFELIYVPFNFTLWGTVHLLRYRST